MKLNTLEKLYLAMRDLRPEIELDEAVHLKALVPWSSGCWPWGDWRGRVPVGGRSVARVPGRSRRPTVARLRQPALRAV